ncbi:MAG: hypothetical protein DIZ80_04060 [endosymbiont of Galathealinum brachiosum]|uniref:Uncharacterized protein n=1 Tax=endosymbiont of Galathealinum brachiosum TaxID=2200906 RepID=A0A370DIA7_9GAMM|nr:MAG: hypothetical protein DIZ80_04060 [endosymbiont of Galathealinum brachiosum]
MDWLKIGSAVFLIAMIVFIWPRMKHAVANSPKGTMQDWMGYIVPLAAVIGFVFLLIQMV